MKRIIALLLAAITVVAYAHQDEAQSPVTGYDCEHPPAGAVTDLPGLLGTVGQLVCLPAGPGILARKEWSWRYTGSFFDLPSIPAHAHIDSAGMPPPFYFTELSSRELTSGEAATRSRELEKEVETYRPGGPVAAMTIVDATNNYGRSIKVYMSMESESSGWVVVCTPKCRPEYVILVNKRKPN